MRKYAAKYAAQPTPRPPADPKERAKALMGVVVMPNVRQTITEAIAAFDKVMELEKILAEKEAEIETLKKENAVLLSGNEDRAKQIDALTLENTELKVLTDGMEELKKELTECLASKKAKTKPVEE